PFFSLLTGYVLGKGATLFRTLHIPILAACFLSSGFLLHIYFFEAPETDADSFDSVVKEEDLHVATEDVWKHFVKRFDYYDEGSIGYFRARYGGMSCKDARAFIRETKREMLLKRSLVPMTP